MKGKVTIVKNRKMQISRGRRTDIGPPPSSEPDHTVILVAMLLGVFLVAALMCTAMQQS